MKKIFTLIAAAIALRAAGQSTYNIDISKSLQQQDTVKLDLGGSSPAGNSITVSNDYILVDGKPFFPVMGEFHFSRYPNEYWEESILKIKAGGINIIATYVFWNLHEPKENEFDWKDDRDLKKFTALCAKHGMKVIVRIGPYGHGEIRNGAIPDWLYGRPIDIRTDDPAYLRIVKRYFGEIAQQLKGQLFKDGGNVIGIQLENEYQHAGSAWWLNYPNSPNRYTFPFSQEYLTRANTWNLEMKEQYKTPGDNHMLTLKHIAKEAGLEVPLYTATGWGYAAIVDKGSLPVSAAYAYPSWGELEPSPFYLFKDLRKDPDYGPVRYDPQIYPSIAAEIGGGIMITNSKRPLVPANSITPLMVRNIGSGSNGIGYYMYHGGSTPVQNGQFMSEEPGELPKISYDFQAPVGEFGQVRASYKELIPLHFFLNTYGSRLAPMAVYLPETNPAIATDTTHLRYSIRSDGTSGFVFMHNYQDHTENTDLNHLQLFVKTKKGVVSIPEEGTFSLKKDSYAILPFNLQVGDVFIRHASVQPFTTFKSGNQEYHVFVSIEGIQPEFSLKPSSTIQAISNCKIKKRQNSLIIKGDGELFSFQTGNEKSRKIFLVIPMALAKNAYALPGGLLFSKKTILPLEKSIDIISRGDDTDTLLFYPAIKTTPGSMNASIEPTYFFSEKTFSAFTLRFKTTVPAIKIEQPRKENAVITMNETAYQGLNDIFLYIDYAGDKGQALLNGQLVTDHFYHGVPWEIGLKRYKTISEKNPLYLYFQPITKGAACLPYLKDHIPPFKDKNEYLEVRSIKVIPEYKCSIRLP